MFYCMYANMFKYYFIHGSKINEARKRKIKRHSIKI